MDNIRTVFLFFIIITNSFNIYPAKKNDINIHQKRWEKSSYIFDLDSLPSITIEVSTNEWNTLLKNFDKNKRNEISVKADFHFNKNNKTDSIENIGIRIRGNMSRKRPEGKKGTLHNPENPEWRPVHFRIKFNQYNNEKKDKFYSLDSINLKWFKDDETFIREIYCYDLFHRFGVYVAPRSSYCRLFIKIKEDEQTAYFGIYQIVEPIEKDFLKTRFNKTKESDNGYLWKCLWGANLRTIANIGIEDPNGVGGIVNYDLKTNKKDFENAKYHLVDFIRKLNKLRGIEFENWISKSFDVDLFLKTYAVNVLVGMWDDYWANNGNNYYLYFDNNGRVYFIPYDYDNTLGTSMIMDNSGTKDVFNWGHIRMPLINKILSIKKYKRKYALYLSQLLNEEKDLFNYDKSMIRIKKWQEMISPYLVNDTGINMQFRDVPADWGNCDFYRIFSGDDSGEEPEANYFKTRIRFAKEQIKQSKIWGVK